MTRRSFLPVLLLAAALAAPMAHAQQACCPPAPAGAMSCLLYVRFVGAPGMRVAFFRDAGPAREFDVPVTAALRPGYCYRVKVTGLPGRPEMVLYPTLEVRGTLAWSPKMRVSDHPTPIVISEDDVRRALDGVFITKLLFLENPKCAVPTATRPDQPIEVPVPATVDLLQAAREVGRPMVILRLGERQADDAEMRHQAIPGTVMLPGDRGLPPPAVPPCLPWACFPVYDPVLGPRLPDEECFQDGGDTCTRATLDADGKLLGLDPTDTVAEYTDHCGRRKITPSNRICICVPRFAALRQELAPAGFHLPLAPSSARCVVAQVQANKLIPSLERTQVEQLTAVRGRQRPSAAQIDVGPVPATCVKVLEAYDLARAPGAALCTARLVELTEAEKVRWGRCVAFALSLSERCTPAQVGQSCGPAVVGRLEGVKVVATVRETDDITCICQEPPVPLPGKPLALCKWADRDTGQVGDVVTFYLKYSNHGCQPISDVAVSDSLSGRLEYVPGSAKSDRPSVFTLQDNEAGSAVLRWEILGTLAPGQSGLVTFQAKIR